MNYTTKKKPKESTTIGDIGSSLTTPQLLEKIHDCFIDCTLQKINELIGEMEQINRKLTYITVLKALRCIKMNRLEQAHEYLMVFVKEKTPFDPIILECMAIFNSTIGRRDCALRQYTKLLSYSDKMGHKVNIMYNIAVCKKENGFCDFALDIFERLLSIPDGYKELPKIYVQIYHIYLIRRDYTALSRMFDMFVFPVKNVFMNRIYAELLYKTGRIQELLIFEESCSFDPYICYLIIRMALLGDVEDVNMDDRFRKVLQFTEDHYVPLNTYGNHLLRMGVTIEAKRCYEICLEGNSKYAPSLYNLEHINKQISDVEEGNLDRFTLSFSPRDIEPRVWQCGFFKTGSVSPVNSNSLDHQLYETCDILDMSDE